VAALVDKSRRQQPAARLHFLSRLVHHVCSACRRRRADWKTEHGEVRRAGLADAHCLDLVLGGIMIFCLGSSASTVEDFL